MVGFDRIVGLDVKYAKTLECPICLAILDNPLMTKCGHNYCHQCIVYAIEEGVKSCPKCRKLFTKKRMNEALDDSVVLIQKNREIFLFFRNLSLKEIISKLTIKCDYESNGCEEVMELAVLSQHVGRCWYGFCPKCQFRMNGPTENHNCIELLKNDRTEWKEKYENSLNRINELEDKLEVETNQKEHFHSKHEKCLTIIKELNNNFKKELCKRTDLKRKYTTSIVSIEELNEKLKRVEEMYDKEKNEWQKKLQIESTSTDKKPMSCQYGPILSSLENKENNNSNVETINEKQVLKCIESGEVDNHLIGVYSGTIQSIRRDIYIKGTDETPGVRLRRSSNLAFLFPISHYCVNFYNYQCCTIFTSEINYFKVTKLQIVDKVLIPEAIVKAISIVHKCDWNRAEELFNSLAN